jgi:hypothetical protein
LFLGGLWLWIVVTYSHTSLKHKVTCRLIREICIRIQQSERCDISPAPKKVKQNDKNNPVATIV